MINNRSFFDVGYAGFGQNFDPSDLNSNAFKSGAWVNVVGGCRTAIDDKFGRIMIEKVLLINFQIFWIRNLQYMVLMCG